MSQTIKSKVEAFVHLILTIVVLCNAVIPTTVLAMPLNFKEGSPIQPEARQDIITEGFGIARAGRGVNRVVAAVTPTPEQPIPPTPYVLPTQIPTLASVGNQSILQFDFSASPAQAKPGDEVTFTITITNNDKVEFKGLMFSNLLPEQLREPKSKNVDLKFDPETNKLTWPAEGNGAAILAGETITLQYTATVDSFIDTEIQVVDEANLFMDGADVPLTAALELSVFLAGNEKEFTPLGPQGGEADGVDGHVSLVVPAGELSETDGILIEDVSESFESDPSAPFLVFQLDVVSQELESDAPVISSETATPLAPTSTVEPQSTPLAPTSTVEPQSTPTLPETATPTETNAASTPGPESLTISSNSILEVPLKSASDTSSDTDLTPTGTITATPTAEPPSTIVITPTIIPTIIPTITPSPTTVVEETPDPNLAPQEQDTVASFSPEEADFDKPVEITVLFDGIFDLSKLGAEYAPYLVTLDEGSDAWVRVPLKSVNREDNTITAELTHFSTWGAGLGAAFPQNSANILLFDNAYPSLFSGNSNYSVPLWTPPGRKGMQPSLALSYSSGSADGILGDLQASWVGMGWNIDSTEIARKITNGGCTPCGGGSYGYKDEFILLLNGTGHELVPNGITPGRYHTKDESFLYIQRHNDSLGNNTPAAPNLTGEWWEVVEKDGTRWRLGWNANSEQLAAMKGYPGTNPPSGAWATLGYAGHAANVVAGRWRVDQVTDTSDNQGDHSLEPLAVTYGNQMTFSYFEENRAVAGTSAVYNRASYIDTIVYTGHTAGNPLPGYSVVFIREERGGNDVPTTPAEWDNWDTKRLDRIDVKYGSTVVRTYDLGYQIRPYSDGGVSWQTTVLTSIAESGLAGTTAPVVSFTYEDKINRASSGTNSIEWAYPRLATINNGWGGVTTYSYENDGRASTSWYNWRVLRFDVNDGVNTSPMKTSFAYATPCYDDTTAGRCNTGNIGSLIGYAQTTATKLAFDGVTVLSKSVHKFSTIKEVTGREYEVQDQNASGTTLHKTHTQYTYMETTAYPDGAYFAFASDKDEFVLTTSLVQTSHTVYNYDYNNGNFMGEEQYYGTNTLFRKTEYEYVTNTSPLVWILNALSRRTVTDSSGAILSEQQYGYDGRLPGVGGALLTSGRRTMSRMVNGTQTIDTAYVYLNPYGNVDGTRLYKNYGTTGSPPSGDYLAYSTGYDPYMQTYAISNGTPLLPATLTGYSYSKGVPTTVTDPNGNVTTTAYDGLGRVTSVTYPGSAQANIKYTYPTAPITAPFAVKMEFWDQTASVYRASWQMMDGLGRVIQTQSPYATANNLVLNDTSYDAQGRTLYSGLPRTVSSTGGAYFTPTWASVPHSTAGYDALGRPASVAYADGSSETFSYSGLRTTSIDRNSHKKVQEKDAFGRLIKVEEYTGANPYTLYATTNYEYDERDLLKKVIDTELNETTMHYNDFGRKDSMTDPDMGSWSYEYDIFGNLNSQTDARECVTTVLYDDLNRPTQKTYSGPGACGTTPQVNYTYDSTAGGNEGIGRRTGMTDGTNTPTTPTTWFYNVLGQVTNETHNIDGVNYSAGATFDAFSRPLTQTLPSAEVLNYTYNAMGALASLIGTNTYVSQIHYAASGQVNDQLLGSGLTQQSCYNAKTLRVSGIRAYSGSVQSCIETPSAPKLNLSYTYQPNGNISQITDATRGETLSYTYDELDRMLSGGGTDSRSYTYGATGNTASQGNALLNPGTSGLVSWWAMDETSGMRYDSYGANHLTDVNTVTSAAGKKANAGDSERDTLEYLKRGSSAQLQMSTSDIYVGAWIKAESFISHPVVLSKRGSTNEYQLRVNPGNIVDFIVWGTNGNLTLASSTTSIVAGQWYYVEGWTDKENRTAYVNVNNGMPGSATWPANENRDGAGSADFLMGARDNNGINEYWDGLLDEAVLYKRVLTPSERAWLYNAGNGRSYADLSLPPSGTSTTYYYTDPAHKHAVTSLSTGETYTYDANGNMITRFEGGLTYNQVFDAENRLVSVTVNNQTTQFLYDGDGNLVRKTNPNGTRTIYVPGGVYEVDKTSDGAVTRTVTYYPAASAMRIDSTLYYILKDHLGSASVVTGASGDGEQRYHPYGEMRFTSGTIYTDKLFTGQREITGLGLYHYGARFYSPKLGRFLSADTIVPDPANPQDLNRFSYVRNNPLRYTDPTGHMVCEDGPCMPSTSHDRVPKPAPSRDGGGNDDDDGNGGGCTTFLCQLSEEDQDIIANGGYYQVYEIDNVTAHHTNAIYGVLLAVPTIILGAPEWVGLSVTYLGGFFSGEIAMLPGSQEGDSIVMVGHAVGEEFVYRGHTYNTEVITNTYYFRADELIWTETEVTSAYPTSRTY